MHLDLRLVDLIFCCTKSTKFHCSFDPLAKVVQNASVYPEQPKFLGVFSIFHFETATCHSDTQGRHGTLGRHGLLSAAN